MQDEVFLGAAALKALADPTRVRVLLAVRRQARTVKELAAVLGVPQTRLYYHVKLLEQNGLIRVADRRLVSGIEERTYLAVSESMTVSPEFPSGDADLAGLVKALMGALSAEIQVALHDEPAAVPGLAASAVPVLTLTDLNLSVEQVAALQARLDELRTEFEAAGDSESQPTFRLVLAAYRVPGSSL